ncbi:hypothetical protein V8F33_010677 [Rhypophila sp. PSN 637]
MNTQQSDPVPNHRGAPENAPSPPSSDAGTKLTDYNLWQLRKESRDAEAKRKGRSVGSDQSTEPYSPARDVRFKPSTVEVPRIDWDALNAEVSKTYKREPSPSDKARVKFEDGWVFGLNNIRARVAAEMAAVTYQEKQSGGLNPNKKRPLDESSGDDGSSTKRQRVEPHATFGYPGVFSSSYKGPDSNPKAPEASSPPVQIHEKSTFRSIFGTPAVKDSESISSGALSQQQSAFGHFPPKPSPKPESSSLFGPVPPKPSAKLPVDELSLFGYRIQTAQFPKRQPTTSGLSDFNDTAPADSLAAQASEYATTKPQPTSALFGFIDATPVDSLALQASDNATTKPPPPSGLFGFSHAPPADNDSLVIQASTHPTTKPPNHAIAATVDMAAYLSTPNLFGAPSPPQDKPSNTKTAPAQKPMKRMEPWVYTMPHQKTHSTFSMDTMAERFFEPTNANDVIHPLDEADAPLDLESYLPPQFPRYYETRHLNETSLFLSRAKYFISLGGPPLRDMTYGIIVVPFGEERLLLCGHSITHGCDKCEPGDKDTVGEGNGDKVAEKELEESRGLREIVEDQKAEKKWWKGDPSWDGIARREYHDEDCKEGEGNAETQVKEGLRDKDNA